MAPHHQHKIQQRQASPGSSSNIPFNTWYVLQQALGIIITARQNYAQRSRADAASYRGLCRTYQILPDTPCTHVPWAIQHPAPHTWRCVRTRDRVVLDTYWIRQIRVRAKMKILLLILIVVVKNIQIRSKIR